MHIVTELTGICALIENDINNCSNLDTHKYVKGRIARARLLIKSLQIINKGLPNNEQINVQLFQQKLDNYDVQLATYNTVKQTTD